MSLLTFCQAWQLPANGILWINLTIIHTGTYTGSGKLLQQLSPLPEKFLAECLGNWEILRTFALR